MISPTPIWVMVKPRIERMSRTPDDMADLTRTAWKIYGQVKESEVDAASDARKGQQQSDLGPL